MINCMNQKKRGHILIIVNSERFRKKKKQLN